MGERQGTVSRAEVESEGFKQGNADLSGRKNCKLPRMKPIDSNIVSKITKHKDWFALVIGLSQHDSR